MLYSRARESQRGEQGGTACYLLAVPLRAIRAGAAGNKDSKNPGELLPMSSFFFAARRFEPLMFLWMRFFGGHAIEASNQE